MCLPQTSYRKPLLTLTAASFKSANGGRVGDLQGIIDKLPYLKSLGVDCIWL